MSIEMDFREALDCLNEVAIEMNKARDGNTNERPDLFAFYLGGSMAMSHKLNKMLIKMAERYVYKVDDEKLRIPEGFYSSEELRQQAIEKAKTNG